jgi:uncharacterized protein YcfL
MKKTLMLIIALLLMVGCNNKKVKKEEKVNLLNEIKLEAEEANMICSSYKQENNYEIAAKYAIFYDKDENITNLESSELIASEDNDILNDFESYYNSNYEKIGNYGGYTYDIHQEKKRLIANVVIDYTLFNSEAYVADYPEIADTFNEDYKLTKDKILKIYKNNGIECEIKQD